MDALPEGFTLVDDAQPETPSAPPARAVAPAQPTSAPDDLPEGFELEPSSGASVAARATLAGAKQAFKDVATSVRGASDLKGLQDEAKTEKPGTGDAELDALLTKGIGEGWNDLNWWAAKLAHGMTASSPMLAGAVLGGAAGTAVGPEGTAVGALAGSALGGAAGSILQTIGPAYVDALQEGKDPDEAFDQAWKQTAVAGGFAAVMGAVPGLSAFGKTAEGALKAPIKEALLQLFGVQPGLMVGQTAASNAVAGRGTTAEQALESYALGAATGVPLVAAHRAYDAARGLRSSGAQPVPEVGPDPAQAAALDSTTAPVKPPAPPSEPVAPPTEGPAGVTDAQRAAIRASIRAKRGGTNNPADNSPPPKGAGTGANPPPRVEPGTGNEQSAPTRSEVEYPKQNDAAARAKAALERAKKAKQAAAPVTSEVAPSAAPDIPPAVAEAARRQGATEQSAPEQRAPEQPAEQAPEQAPEAVQPPTVPESPDTLAAQVQELLNGTRKAVMYPTGTEVPRTQLDGTKRVKTDAGVFDYNPKLVKAKDILAAVKDDRINELLGLGPFNKQEVAASAARGNPEVAVVERTPEGVEAKAAAGTTETAPVQAQALEAQRAPENTVTVERPTDVLAERQAAQPPVTPEVASPEAGPRILKPPGVEEAEAARAEQLSRGHRGKDDGVAPEHGNAAAQKRFLRRAQAAVDELGDKAPQHYRDALESASQRTKGRSEKNAELSKKINEAWDREYALEQQGTPRQRVKSESSGAFTETREARKQAKEEARAEAKDNAPLEEATKEELDRAFAAYPELKALYEKDPERVSRIVATLRKTSADEASRRPGEFREETTADTSAMRPDEAVEAQQEEAAREKRAGSAKETVGAGARAETDEGPAYQAFAPKTAKVVEKVSGRRKLGVGPKVEGKIALNKQAREPGSERILPGPREEEELRLQLMSDDEILAELRRLPIFEKSVPLGDGHKVVPLRTGTVESEFAKLTPTGKGIGKAFFNIVRDRLVQAVPDVKIHFVRAADIEAYWRSVDPHDPHIRSFYNRETHSIFIVDGDTYQQKRFNHTMLHEAVHAATDRGLNENTALSWQLTRLMEEVRALDPRLDAAYGMKNLREFTAEALTNIRFQQELARLEVSPKLAKELGLNGFKTSSVWGVLVDAVRSFLRLPKNTYSVLEAAMKVTDEVMLAQSTNDRAMLRYAPDASREAVSPIWAAPPKKGDLEKKYYGVLRSMKVAPEMAREIAKTLHEELGPNAAFKEAKPLLKELAKEYGMPLQGPPGSKRAAAIQQQQAQARATSQGNGGSNGSGNPPAAAPIGPKGRGVLQRVIDRAGGTGVGEKFRESLLDYNRPVERIQELAESKLGRQLADEEAFYEQKGLLEPKIQGKISQFERGEGREVQQILRDANEMGVSPKDLDNWLRARAAEERNAYLEAKTGEADKSGMTTAEAQRILADVAADPKQQALFDRLVKYNDDLRVKTLDAQVESGLMTRDSADRLLKMFKNYTNMSGFSDEALAKAVGGDESLVGRQGVSVLGREVGTLKGRKTESDSPVSNMARAYLRAVERAERNKVLASAAETIRKAGFTKEDGVYVAENLGATPASTIREAILDPRILGFKENGTQKFLIFSDKELAKSFERLSADEMNAVAGGALRTYNQVKNLYTHYSPEFLLRHYAFRYPIEGAVNLSALKELGINTKRASYFKEIYGDIPDVYRYLSGNEPKDPNIAAYMKRMEDAGGVVSFKSYADRLDIKELMKNLEAGTEKGKLEAAHEAWSTMLTAMDNAQRLSVFMRAVKAGYSDQKAARMARDATVDFNRKGSKSGLFSLWAPFGNVALQTTARLTDNFAKSPAFRRTIYGVMAAATAIELMNYMLGGNDKDGTPWAEKIPSYQRIQNLVMLLPTKDGKGQPHMFKIPLPYPLFGIWTAGSGVAQAALGAAGLAKISNGEIATRIMHGMAETFTPFGRDINNPAAAVTPVILRPVTELAMNRDWKGDSIHTDFPRKGMKRSEQLRTGTNPAWGTFAQGLAKIGIDAYPEDVRYLTDQVVGAQRRFVSSLAAPLTEGSANRSVLNNIPGARLVVGGVEGTQADRSRMFNLEHKAEVTPAELKALRTRQPNAAERTLISVAEKRTGLTSQQLLAVNNMAGEVKKFDTEVRKAPYGSKAREAAETKRNEFITKKMKELNDLGIRGGLDRH